MSRWLLVLVLLVAAAAGVTLATFVGHDEQPLPEHPGQPGSARSFLNVTTVISGTTYVCTSPCETETLGTDGQQRDTVRATSLIDETVAAIRTTTISGRKYCLAMAGCRGTGYAYRGGAWYVGAAKHTLAEVLSPVTTLYDDAAGHLMLTTISGTTYFANREKYAGGHWDLAIRDLAQERAYLVANPLKRGPSIYTLPK